MSTALPAIAGALLGAIFGSFLTALIIRWPETRSIVTGRSLCVHCGTVIAGVRLVPLISYVGHRGRAACCGKPVAAFG